MDGVIVGVGQRGKGGFQISFTASGPDARASRDRVHPHPVPLLLAVVMDDIDTLLSGFTLCLAYVNFPSSTFIFVSTYFSTTSFLFKNVIIDIRFKSTVQREVLNYKVTEIQLQVGRTAPSDPIFLRSGLLT